MSREKLKELLKKRSTKIGSVVLAAALVFGGGMWAGREPQVVIPELVSFVDPVQTVTIEDEETPLASTKSVKTSTKTKKKKIRLKKKSKKSYTKKGKTTKSKKVKISGKKTITTVTVTKIKYVFKKGSKIKTQVSTITTTVTTVTKGSTKKTTVAGAQNPNGKPIPGIMAKRDQPYVESKVNSKVINAFNTLRFRIDPNPAKANADKYTGKFDASERTITVKVMDGTVYHELGHFLAFIAGNYDKTSAFVNVYNAEKNLYGEYNKDYAIGSSSEYFAESFCQYVLDPSGLKNSRPKTYAAIEDALKKINVKGAEIALSMGK